MDGEGVRVRIGVPFRGMGLTWGAWGVGGYLSNTHAPGTVLHAGGPWNRERFAKEAMSWIYPQVLQRDSLWDAAIGRQSQRAKGEIETLLAYNPGAYLGNGGSFGMVPLLRAVGLPVLTLFQPARKGNRDDVIYSAARVETALIEHPERGEALIERYRQAYADLRRELSPETLATFPSMLMMGSSTRDRGYFYLKSVRNAYQIYFPPAGVTNASKGLTGEREDAERILSMDPDTHRDVISHLFIATVALTIPFSLQFLKQPERKLRLK